MNLTRSNHCVYDTHYHVVFPVKYSKALLSPAVASAVVEIAHEIELRFDIVFEKIGTDGDHILRSGREVHVPSIHTPPLGVG